MMMVLAVFLSAGTFVYAEEILKVGVLVPLSGGGALWGVPVDRGIRQAAEDVNNAGGIKADGKIYKIKVFSEDTEYSANVGLAAFNKLVDQLGVKYIIGPIDSGTEKSTKPIAEAKKVITMHIGSARPLADDFYTYKSVQVGDQYLPATWLAMKKIYPDTKKIVVFQRDNEGGHLYGGLSKAYAKILNVEILDMPYVPLGMTDYYPILTKVLAKKPDAIVTGSVPPGDHALMIKQARELGYRGPFISDGGSDKAVVEKIAGPGAAEGMIQSGMSDYIKYAVTPQMREAGKRYLEKHGAQDPWSLDYYNDIFVIKQGIEDAGTIDTTAVVKAWRDPGFKATGLYGEVRWVGKDLYGRNAVLSTPLPISQIKDGKEVVVTTIPYEEMKPLILSAMKSEK